MTLKAREQEVREFVAAMNFHVHYLEGTYEYECLALRLRGHHDSEAKIGLGLDYFKKGRAEYNKPAVFLKRRGDEAETFSWLKCVTGRPPTPAAVQTRMFRGAIEQDVVE
jgi:hypothetical protein